MTSCQYKGGGSDDCEDLDADIDPFEEYMPCYDDFATFRPVAEQEDQHQKANYPAYKALEPQTLTTEEIMSVPTDHDGKKTRKLSTAGVVSSETDLEYSIEAVEV